MNANLSFRTVVLISSGKTAECRNQLTTAYMTCPMPPAQWAKYLSPTKLRMSAPRRRSFEVLMEVRTSTLIRIRRKLKLWRRGAWRWLPLWPTSRRKSLFTGSCPGWAVWWVLFSQALHPKLPAQLSLSVPSKQTVNPSTIRTPTEGTARRKQH